MSEKKCWRCAEAIKAEAIACRFCGADQKRATVAPPSKEASRKALLTAGMIVAVIAIFAVVDYKSRPVVAVPPPPATTASPREMRQGPAPISDNIFTPYTRRAGYEKTFAIWGDAGVRRIQRLREAAAKTVADKHSCDSVEISDISTQRSEPPNKPVVFVDCQNGARFYFDETGAGLRAP